MKKKNKKPEVVLPDLSYKVNGLLYEVHNKLGRYCNEKQYADAFEELLKKNNILYKREYVVPASFEGELHGRNKVDFLIEEPDGSIVLEFKVARVLTRDNYYQMRRYLQALRLRLGLLVNFRNKYLKPRRVLNAAASIRG